MIVAQSVRPAPRAKRHQAAQRAMKRSARREGGERAAGRAIMAKAGGGETVGCTTDLPRAIPVDRSDPPALYCIGGT